MESITPRELKRRLDAGEPIELLDVREPEEHALVRLPRSRLIPLGELPQRVGELDPAREFVVYCHHGIRSARAIAALRAEGFERLANLRGGIDAWARDVDPQLPRY